MFGDVDIAADSDRLAQASLGHAKQRCGFALASLVRKFCDVDSAHGPSPWLLMEGILPMAFLKVNANGI